MIVKDLFEHKIDRDLKGVIKVGQDDDANIKQELEEYVVTKELQKHFSDFFSSYKRSINGSTDKVGTWISGFFGSGKSHFLKILSYLLENKVVDGKPAIEYFIDDNKISDSMVLADMKLACTLADETDVISFNIDAKNDGGTSNKESVLSVFLKVFNEAQGYCGQNPYIADFEAKLDEKGLFGKLKTEIQAELGQPWEVIRNELIFNQDEVASVIEKIGFLTKQEVMNWYAVIENDYKISIQDFAKLVKKYIEKKGPKHRVVFLVDEIGQYVGDDAKLMLSVQTIVEQLGIECKGRAWVVVTGQQEIDEITKVIGGDYSKIQGRFDTKISLSSANVDEVIKKRILEKTETGSQTLSVIYDQNATIIKNLILFDNEAELKLFNDSKDFAAVYPFIPYQFNLLGNVLTAVRQYGASGKHLADGERSMLALFKESAAKLKDKDLDVFVPFDMFYDALEEFVDSQYKNVIGRAKENGHLNPTKDEDCFAVNVLKVLFLIKHVNSISANLENITSLMVSSINDDRLALKNKVEEALKALIRETLVQKNGDEYMFLSDEEQEINRQIDRENVEQAEIIHKISELIFDGMFKSSKYKCPQFNGRYAFAYNQIVDDRPYGNNQTNSISVKILTPDSDERGDETKMRMLSSQTSSVVVVLPDDRTFIEEQRLALKIEKFIRKNPAGTAVKYEEIKAAKMVELRSRNDAVKVFLTDALKNADIYVNGDKVTPSAKDGVSKINEGLDKLISTVYHKLSYIDTPMDDADIKKLFNQNNKQIAIAGTNPVYNANAITDFGLFIAGNTAKHSKTSMKSLLEHFMKPPYGFIEADIWWLTAKLFVDNEIALFLNNDAITQSTKTVDEIIRYITRKEFYDKLLTDKKEKVNVKQIQNVKDIMKELFNVTSANDNEETLMQSFKGYCSKLKNDLDKFTIYYNQVKDYPGQNTINQGIVLMQTVDGLKYAAEFYDTLFKKSADYFDFADDYEPIKQFFNGGQKAIFDTSLSLMKVYDDSKPFFVNQKVEDIVKKIKDILYSASPFAKIKDLPQLNDDFRFAYVDVFNEKKGPVDKEIQDARDRVEKELSGKACEAELTGEVTDSFNEIKNKADTCNNVAVLLNLKQAVDALKIRLLDKIAEREAAIQKANAPAVPANPANPQPVVQVKKQKSISVKSINTSNTWRIESKEDIDKYVGEFRDKLIDSLEQDTVINVEF